MNFKKFLSTVCGMLTFATIMPILGTPVKATFGSTPQAANFDSILQEVRSNNFSSPVYTTATAVDKLRYIWKLPAKPGLETMSSDDMTTALSELSTWVDGVISDAIAQHGDAAAHSLNLYFIPNYKITAPDKQNQSGEGIWVLAHYSEDAYNLISQLNAPDRNSQFHYVSYYPGLLHLNKKLTFFNALLSKFQYRNFSVL